MPRRDFGGVPDLRPASPDPIEFGLAGGSFRCRDEVPVDAMAAVDQWPAIDDTTNQDSPEYKAFLGKLIDFLHGCVVDDDRTAFLGALTTGVEDTTLIDLFQWVCTEYTKRYRERGGPAGAPAVVPVRPSDDPDGVLAALPRSDLEDVLAVANQFGGTIGEPLS